MEVYPTGDSQALQTREGYHHHGAGVFSTICSKWALLFDCTSEGATANFFIWGGGGGGGGGGG